MEYTVTKVDGQALMFHIQTTHNGKDVAFDVVCGFSEDEVAELVAFHLAYLDSEPSAYGDLT